MYISPFCQDQYKNLPHIEENNKYSINKISNCSVAVLFLKIDISAVVATWYFHLLQKDR